MGIRFRLGGALLLLSGALAQAQPVIFPNGIVNAASYVRPGLPGGAIGRGSVFSIFGKSIGPASSVQVSSFPLQPALGGVSVKATQGQTSVDVIPLFVSAGQINAIMPSNTPLGMVSLQVTFNNQKSNASPVRVLNSSFGAFSANSGGFGPSAVLNFISQASQPFNSLAASASPMQVVTLFGTGLGPVAADNVAPTAGTLPTPLEIWVGGAPVAGADILYAGRTPCCAGIDQLVFRLPQNAPLGCHVPLLVRTDKTVLGNVTTIAIQQPGKAACSDALNPFGPLFQPAGKAGAILLSRVQFLAQIDRSQPLAFTTEFGTASFSEETGSQFAFNSHLAFPPPGSCTVYTGSRDLLFEAALPGAAPSGRFLDAGMMFTVNGPGGSRTIVKTANPGDYGGILGSDRAGLGLPALFLNPGNFSITGAGGADVGSLQANLAVAPVINFPGLSGLVSISRNQDLKLAWAAPDPSVQLVAVAGSNYDVPTDSSAAFFCTALPGDLSVTVPAVALSALPASRGARHQSHGRLLMSTFTYGPKLSNVSGVKAVQTISISAKGQSVLFR